MAAMTSPKVFETMDKIKRLIESEVDTASLDDDDKIVFWQLLEEYAVIAVEEIDGCEMDDDSDLESDDPDATVLTDNEFI